jgi:hypothetical protein
MTLVPIKIKILLDNEGNNLYPRFNDIPSDLRNGMNWSNFFDAHGLGWHFDKKSGFHVSDTVNPDPCCQFGMTCVPAEFAEAAAKMFPDTVKIVSEEVFEKFYDQRAHEHEDTEFLDADVLIAIQARIALEEHGTAPTVPPSRELLEERRKCLDPSCQENRGIRKNIKKTWAGYKKTRVVKIRDTEAKP